MTLDPDPLTVYPEPDTDDEPWRVPRMTDADKLRVLAAWFDMWDRPETDRQRILDDRRNPGRNDVQRDLRRMAADMERPDARRWWALAIAAVVLFVVAVAWWR